MDGKREVKKQLLSDESIARGKEVLRLFDEIKDKHEEDTKRFGDKDDLKKWMEKKHEMEELRKEIKESEEMKK